VKNGFVGFVLRPSVRTKLLNAFLVIEVLLLSVGVIGLLSLREADQQANQSVDPLRSKGGSKSSSAAVSWPH
jgi:hypothetical protein